MRTSHRFAVMLAVDRSMFAPAVFTAHSALSGTPKSPFDLIIAVPQNAIPRTWIDYAETQVGATVREVPFDRHLSSARTINRYPPSALYRYFFNQFLDSGYRKVIYLDADIRAVGDISVLFDLDLEGQPFAAAPDVSIHSDVFGQWRSYLAGLGLDETACYANTGVLVIDPHRWAMQNMSERILTYLSKHPDACHMVDQSALNALVRGEFLKLSPVWNMMSRVWFGLNLADLVHPVVFHYSGANKPWRPLTWRHERAVSDLYRDFFRHTPWPDAVSWLGTFAEWLQFLTFRRQTILRRLRGAPSFKPVPAQSVLKFRQFLQTVSFADVRQGLATWQPDGSLRAARQSYPASASH